jgi:HD-GYP domain-containing protein (c-di-GMP phosphodiesterase class II)
VPEWAGGHHEKMDGTGYPRGLKRDEMSIPARIMMIADIFEALTARDRPYKARKTLSECIDIMARMSRERHIDPDLFELLLTSGVYREYADMFLVADQIDEIDIARHLAACRPPAPAAA